MNQKEMFYQSHCSFASDIHTKMAELQRKSGRNNLANSSERTALARRISKNNWIKDDLVGNLEYGEEMVKTNLV